MSIELAQQIKFDLNDQDIPGSERTVRRLKDLEGFFADEKAYRKALKKDNSLIYHVQSISPADGDGDLHYGLGTLMPGKIGKEYYLTKGHLHSWREAAEVYIGLQGNGFMILEEEGSGETKMFKLEKNSIMYVPGYIAHRTIHCDDKPLKYLGVYPSAAGHDYGAIAERNFLSVVVEINGDPKLMERDFFIEKYI
jgi:glucose-6-phosphate isomerase